MIKETKINYENLLIEYHENFSEIDSQVRNIKKMKKTLNVLETDDI